MSGSAKNLLNLKTVGLLLCGILVMLLAACSEDEEAVLNLIDIDRAPETSIVIPAGEPVVVGVSTALTGSIGPRGSEYRDAVVVGVEQWKAANGPLIGGHQIEVQSKDDGCSEADVTRVAADRLLRRKGLVGVIGPQCSGGSTAVIPIYAEAGIVAISGSATRTDLTLNQPDERFFFRTAFRNDLEGVLIGSFLISNLGAQAVYLVDDSEPYGEDLIDIIQDILQENDIEVTRASVTQGDVDFSGLASTIADANPDFVGFAGFNPEAALLFRQLRDAGYTGVYGAGDGAASVSGFVEPLGELAEGVLFAGCRVNLPDDFVNTFFEVHGQEPGTASFSGHYADATRILLDAVAAVAQQQPDGSLLFDPVALRDAVRDTSLENGITGPISFDESGDRVPRKGATLSEVVQSGFESQDAEVYVALGLIPCQVQDGALVNLLGPEAGEIR